MNKEDAAKVLEVSTKTVVNYSNLGLLKVTYVKGKTRPVADYDANAVHELKAKIDAGEIQIGKRELRSPENVTAKTENVETAIVPVSRNPIMKQGNGNQESGNFFIIGPGELKQLVSLAGQSNGIRIENKPLLTFPEAALLTGLSERHLRTAAKKNELLATRMGKADRILREDLDNYLKSQRKKK